MSYYRLNVRFNLENERERLAAEYLQKLPEKEGLTRNRFAVEALCEHLSYKADGKKLLLEEIRQMLREEFKAVSLSAPTFQAYPEEVRSEEAKQSILSDLDELFG